MEKEKNVKKILTKTGAFVSGMGAITITEGLLTRHGELESAGVLIGGIGASIILTGIRRDKIK